MQPTIRQLRARKLRSFAVRLGQTAINFGDILHHFEVEELRADQDRAERLQLIYDDETGVTLENTRA